LTSDRIDREASDWFARLRGPDGEDQRDAFEQWRAADPRHAEAYAQYEKLWAAAAAVRRPREARASTGIRWTWPALAAASVAVVLAVVVGLWGLGGGAPGPGQPPLVAFEAASAKALRLDDGSVVLLAPGATVSVAYTAEAREVRLTGGEARFVVAHDTSRPFRVLAGACSVLATGTVFDVRLSGGNADVALIEGRVEVRTAQGRSVRLAPGEGVASDGTRRSARTPQRWTPPRVSVEAMPLREVLALANRGATTPIELADTGLGGRLVTGTFDLADTRALARKLAAALDLSLDESGGRLLLAGPR
jgi:transmembrane sensor